MRALLAARWVARATRSALAAHVVPRSVAVLLVLVQVDAMTPLPSVSRQLRALPARTAGLVLAAAIALAVLSEREAIGDLLLGPRHAVLRRQPIRGRDFGPAALVVLVPLGWPLGALGFLFGGSDTALLWLGLWLVPAVLARRSGLALVAASAAGAVASIAHAVPSLAAPIALAIWACAVPAAGALALRLAADPGTPPPARGPRPWGPTTGLIVRDLLVLWRAEPALSASAAAGLLVGAPIVAMNVYGRWDPAPLEAAALVGLALLGPVALSFPSAVARRLGRQLDPPEWPIPALQRAAALAAVGALALVPGWASAAVAAPPIGVAGHARIAAFVAALGTGAAWWVASRPARPNAGSWGWWIAGCLALALAGGGLPVAAVAGIALWRASAALERRRA